MRYFVIWLHNKTDSRDDEPTKVLARSKEHAVEIAMCDWDRRNRFTVGRVYTLQEFKKAEPWWHSMFWGNPAINETRKKRKRNK